MPRPPIELIRCPDCGKVQSRDEYERFCCWSCGCFRPLSTPSVLHELRPSDESLPVGQDESVGVTGPGEAGAEEYVDESRIKKMSEL